MNNITIYTQNQIITLQYKYSDEYEGKRFYKHIYQNNEYGILSLGVEDDEIIGFGTKQLNILPQHVQKIDMQDVPFVFGITKGSFDKFANLQQFIAPKRLAKVEYQSFANMKNLQEVYFFNNLKYIGFEAFFGCVNLKKVHFDNSVKLGHDVFYGCGLCKK